MQSIRRRLSIIIICCSVIAILLSALFVNLAVNDTFNKYMVDIQNQRNDRIVQYFEEIYKRDKKWTSTSGEEMQHEAYMSNYCIPLLNADKKVIWQMNPNDINERNHIIQQVNSGGVYISHNFPVEVNGKIVGYVNIGQYSPILLSKQDINFKLSINKGIIFSVLISIIIVIIISIIISKQFSRPIQAVAETSVELSNGNYESASSIKTNIIELNNLTQSINSLGNKLSHQDMLRKRLVSDLSHEIRTPLNVLQNNLEAMIDGIYPVNEERLNYLNNEVIRFSKLLDNLNALKEFEKEESELNLETFALDELVVSICNEFIIEFKNKNISLDINIEAGNSYEMIGDYDKLKQVFINLLSNSKKFTEAGGKVWIQMKQTKDKIVVSIKDNGIGINKEDLPYIFERLYRGDKSRHKIEGNGLGLTIAKKIIDNHMGTISVDSNVGAWTVFTVSFTAPIFKL